MSQPPEQPETPERPRRRVGLVVSLLVFVLLAGASVTGGAGLLLHRAYIDPGPLAGETVVVIPPGTSGQGVADLLEESGVTADAWLMRVALRVLAPDRPLRAGEYAFPAAISLRDAIAKLQRGDTVVRRVTVAEGLTTREALAVIAGADGLEGPVPDADRVGEGSLLPETYHYSLGDSRAAILARMQAAMDETVSRLWAGRRDGLPLASPEDAVILASIVERETAVPGERAKVASVFINRLERGMRLQSDPTVVYGLGTETEPFTGRLLRRHLAIDHPHNTYTRDGLPPTPIANPGVDSIAAVLNPLDTEYYYFVADGSGGHAFARTLAEHNRNVANWRRVQREQRRNAQ